MLLKLCCSHISFNQQVEQSFITNSHITHPCVFLITLNNIISRKCELFNTKQPSRRFFCGRVYFFCSFFGQKALFCPDGLVRGRKNNFSVFSAKRDFYPQWISERTENNFCSFLSKRGFDSDKFFAYRQRKETFLIFVEKSAFSCPLVSEERKFLSSLFKPQSHLQWVVGVDISPM